MAVTESTQTAGGIADTIAILGLDGHVRAKVQFKPMPTVALGCGEGGYVPAAVITAAGAVYYLSADGVIRRLTAGGRVTDVARLPILTDSQVSWFAVSPDGKAIMATIIAFPPVIPSQSCIQRQPGPTQIEVLKSATTGSFTVLKSDQQDTTKSPPQGVLTVIGWDGAGVIANTSPAWYGIGSPPGQIWGDTALRLDEHGNPGMPIGGTGCQPIYGMSANGDVLCFDRLQPTVKDGAGNLLWKLKALSDSDGVSYGDVRLSPDATHVAFALYNDNFTYNSAVIRGRDGTRIGLSVPFAPEGWLDNDTVIGSTGQIKVTCSGCPQDADFNELALVRLSNPTHIDRLGVNATLVGVIQAAA